MRQTKTASTVTSLQSGLLRIALAAVVALLLSRAWPASGMEGAYLCAGLAFLFGVFLVVGRPQIFLRERLIRVCLDSVLIGVLVAYTGGADSPFFPLYLLAALGVAWIETRLRVAVATAALVVGYPAAVVVLGGLGDLVSTPVALR